MALFALHFEFLQTKPTYSHDSWNAKMAIVVILKSSSSITQLSICQNLASRGADAAESNYSWNARKAILSHWCFRLECVDFFTWLKQLTCSLMAEVVSLNETIAVNTGAVCVAFIHSPGSNVWTWRLHGNLPESNTCKSMFKEKNTCCIHKTFRSLK